jgi:hypothetical protein
MEHNTLLIIEENEDGEEGEKEAHEKPKLKLAMASKRLKEEFFRENEINKTTETMNEDYETQIDRSLLEMEQTIGRAYNSDSDSDDEELSTPNGNDEDELGAASSYGQQVPSMLLPFFERRRLSECKEESETDEEPDDDDSTPTKPTIIITETNGTTHQPVDVAPQANRFVVTKAKEEEIQQHTPVKQPVSILKKTPSPPSHQKSLNATHSPKNVRYEAGALRFVSSEKNSHTIHFPCSSDRANVKSFFSPQGILSPRIDKRYFDSSLVEVRASQTTLDTNSTKSLDDNNTRAVNADVWIKRSDPKQDDKISVSSSDSNSITESNRRADVRERERV